MRLTYRDGITTILAGCVVAVTLAVTEGWGWPLLGSARAGVAVVGVLGIAMCAIGARAADMATRESFKRHPGMIVGAVLGSLALALIVAGLIVGSEGLVRLLMVDILVLWAVATVRHALVPGDEADTDGVISSPEGRLSPASG